LEKPLEKQPLLITSSDCEKNMQRDLMERLR